MCYRKEVITKMGKLENGYIYILTNKSFHKSNLVKIGWTTDVEKRIKELSNTSVPEPFECYATYEVPFDSHTPDKAFHNLIQKLNPSLRITPNREFFEIEPWDAYEILESMAKIHNRLDKLVRYSSVVASDKDEDNDSCYSIDYLFGEKGENRNLFERLKGILLQINNYNITIQKRYVAFKKDRKHNLISVWPKSGWIEIVFCAKLGKITDTTDTIYDISNRGWSSAQYAMRFDASTDNEFVKNIIRQIIEE